MPNPPTTLSTSATPGIDWSRLHFLLVEDNEDHQWLMSAVLRSTRVKVAVVERGEDAVKLVTASFAADHPFDLILMDIRLPTIDGYEATRRIRAAGYTGPIVAITARVMETEIDECQRSGCDACISKPFDQATLRDTLAELLPGPVAPLQLD
jgi:CheY-like chemotaxis protein